MKKVFEMKSVAGLENKTKPGIHVFEAILTDAME